MKFQDRMVKTRQGERQILQFLFPKEELLECELRMLQYCRIPGLLKPICQFQDAMVSLCYDITDLEVPTLNRAKEMELYPKHFKKTAAKMAEYFLDAGGLVLAQEALFYQKEKKEWQFLFLPLCDKKDLQDMTFFRSFFQQQPRLFLQMEMMKDDKTLQLEDYLALV